MFGDLAAKFAMDHGATPYEACGLKDPRKKEKQVDTFKVKDSGKREQFESGMVRDTTEGKTDYTLVLDGPMFWRWAEHLTKGAVKYEARNWMKAEGQAELERARQSALRHFLQWMRGDVDEDHASACYFNINLVEYIHAKNNNSNTRRTKGEEEGVCKDILPS